VSLDAPITYPELGGCEKPRSAAGRKAAANRRSYDGTENPCFRHGHKTNAQISPEYRVWTSMIQRCTNPARGRYSRYGGRGITVCEPWRDSFEAFLADMGKRPSADHSLDRIDNDGNYEPGNCRWATRSEQARNTCRVRTLEIDGVSRPMVEWAELAGISYWTYRQRIDRGEDPRDAMRPVAEPGTQYQRLEGARCGNWTVVAHHGRDRSGHHLWRARCACGTERVLCASTIRHRKSTSCGCLRRRA
jgi:hypothetical protein